jgi:hypothetical protein
MVALSGTEQALEVDSGSHGSEIDQELRFALANEDESMR